MLLLLIVFSAAMISIIIPVLAKAELLTALSQTGINLGRDIARLYGVRLL